MEGRIRREPGALCGLRALRAHLRYPPGRPVTHWSCAAARAHPKRETLRDSGCTFCGLCVLVCPTGALTAPGAKARAGWRHAERSTGWHEQALPPEDAELQGLGRPGRGALRGGVLTLLDATGQVLRIAGVADLQRGLKLALAEPLGAGVVFQVRDAAVLHATRDRAAGPVFSGARGSPLGNDLGDDLFADDARVACAAMASDLTKHSGTLVVGVLSDTHGHLYPQVRKMLEGVDHIIHAGDIGSQPASRGPQGAGSGDGGARQLRPTRPGLISLPVEAEVELGGVRILVGHIAGRLNETLARAQNATGCHSAGLEGRPGFG